MNRNNQNRKNNNYFRDFYPEEKVKEKLEKKELFKSSLEYNEDRNEWFVVKEDKKRVYIKAEYDRNRALKGDKVVVEIDPKNIHHGKINYI